MASHKSAVKAERQSKKKREINRSILSKIKSIIKKANSAVESKQAEAAKSLLPELTSLIQKAASKGILHKNTASRKVSQIAAKINGLLASPSGIKEGSKA